MRTRSLSPVILLSALLLAALLLGTPWATHSTTAQPLPTPTTISTSTPNSHPLVAPPRQNRAPLPPISPSISQTGNNLGTNDSLQPTPTPAAPTATALPTPIILRSVPVSYRAIGSFNSQTTFANGSITLQQGTFTITHAAPFTSAITNTLTNTLTISPAAPLTLVQTSALSTTLGAAGGNESVMLTTSTIGPIAGLGARLGANSRSDTVTIFQVDDYIAVSFGNSARAEDWAVLRRSQGSSLLKAIQPIGDLARAFPAIAEQATRIGPAEVAGIATGHYRIDDPALIETNLIRPLLAISGEIIRLQMDVWLVEGPDFVLRYEFEVAIEEATVLDAQANPVQADQTVTWSYELRDLNAPLVVGWPPGAPQPGTVTVTGFAPGTFPLPPGAELISIYNGIPELFAPDSVDAVEAFYRLRLVALGWLVKGEQDLLMVSKEGMSFQILLTPANNTGNNVGTHINVLPGPAPEPAQGDMG